MHFKVCQRLWYFQLICPLPLVLFHWIFAFSVNVQGMNYESDLPKIILEPPDIIYFSSSPFQSSTQFLPKFDLSIIISASNASVRLAALQPRKSDRLIQLPTWHAQDLDHALGSSFAQPYAQIRSELAMSNNAKSLHYPPDLLRSGKPNDLRLWTAAIYHLMPEMQLCFLVQTRLGTIRSRPVQIKETVLPDFPRYADENLSLLIGNTARLICHLPMSEPSLPTVMFHHNGIQLNLDQDDRYRLIYVGGYGTGLPWEEQIRKQPFRRIRWPNADKYGQSAVLLMIHSLRLSDTGQYRCQAYLGNKTVMSEQRITLTVTKPHEKVPARLKFSSDDLDLAYLFNNIMPSSITGQDDPKRSLTGLPISSNALSIREFLIPEGYNLTLFCIYEAAPMVSTRWYFEEHAENIRIDKKFGILSIGYVTTSNEGVYSCSAETPHSKPQGKTFRVRVLRNSQTNAKSPQIIHASPGESISMHCNSYPSENYSPYDHEILRNAYSQSFNSGRSSIHQSNRSSMHRFDTHFPMMWVHDGQSIMESISGMKYDLKGTTIRILNISKSDSGIYQCITTSDSVGWATDYHVLIVNRSFKSGLTNKITKTEDASILEYTKEGLTGHLNCNISANLNKDLLTSTNMDNQYPWSLLWYRGHAVTEPLNIEASNKASGGIKYILSSVTEGNQILSIVNPKKGNDDGPYTCKVYDTTTGKLLGEQKFQLIIHSSNELIDIVSEPQSPKSSSEITKSIEPEPPVPKPEAPLNQTKSESANSIRNQDLVGPLKALPDLQKTNLNQISRPLVQRLAEFLTALHISWSMTSPDLYNISYQIEARREMIRRSLFRNQTKRDLSYSNSYGPSVEPTISNLIRLPIRTQNTSLIIDFPQLIQPGSVYSFRVIGMSVSQHSPTFASHSESTIVSPWSHPISFVHILDIAPQIISLSPINSSSLSVEWIYFPSSNMSNLAELSQTKMNFILVYRKLAENAQDRKPLFDLWISRDYKSRTSLNQVPGFPELTMQIVEGGISQRKAILNGLEEQTVYAVSVYGKQTRSSNKIGHDSNQLDWFTPLSNEAIQKTLSMNHSRMVNPKGANTSDDEASKSQISSQSVDLTQSALKNSLFSASFDLHQHESYVLIVILGSLAGVLMVAFIALTTFCVWYKIRIKNRLGRAYYESPSDIDPGDNSMHRNSKEHDLLTSNQISPQNTNAFNQTLPYGISNLQMQQYTWARQRASFIDTSTLTTHAKLGSQPNAYSTATWTKVHPHDLNQAINLYWAQQQQQLPTSHSHQQTQNTMTAHLAQEGLPNPLSRDVNQVMGTLGQMPTGYPHLMNPDLVQQTMNEKALTNTTLDAMLFNGLDQDNRECMPVNDQSSSIYSHIDSESTNHELSNWNLDKYNQIQPNQTHQRNFNSQTNNLDFQNGDHNMMLESASDRDKLVQSGPFYMATQLDEVQIDKDDSQGAMWYHIAPKYTQDPNSFYTTVPPFRHLQFPFAENPLVSPLDPVLLGQNQFANPHLVQSYLDELKSRFGHLTPEQLVPMVTTTSMPVSLIGYSMANNTSATTTPTTTTIPFEPIHTLTATMTLQQWVENMSSNSKHAPENRNVFGQTQIPDRNGTKKQSRSLHSTSSPSNDLMLNHNNKNNNSSSNNNTNSSNHGTNHNMRNNSYRSDNHQNSARENLSSSFADSGVDLPVTGTTDLEFQDPSTLSTKSNLQLTKYDSDDMPSNLLIHSRQLKDRSNDIYLTNSEVFT